MTKYEMDAINMTQSTSLLMSFHVGTNMCVEARWMNYNVPDSLRRPSRHLALRKSQQYSPSQTTVVDCHPLVEPIRIVLDVLLPYISILSETKIDPKWDKTVIIFIIVFPE